MTMIGDEIEKCMWWPGFLMQVENELLRGISVKAILKGNGTCILTTIGIIRDFHFTHNSHMSCAPAGTVVAHFSGNFNMW